MSVYVLLAKCDADPGTPTGISVRACARMQSMLSASITDIIPCLHWAIPKPPLALHFRDGTPNERLNLRMTNSHTFHIMLMVKGKSLYDGSKQALKLAPILKMGQKGNWAERGGDPQHCISSGESLLSFFTQSKLGSGFKTRFFLLGG